ncbi:glycogen debranching protein [Paenibacillus donghaensis]|uniref:alpha-L-rhamnosidase-related protein n=1 Tax=Paenibacillus donghaensis TaxID=414771 RepID=UPI001883963E|nr:glycogen debranching protein [Paenibacillus donghaensis]MBE9915577.1 glycogen debranching protein [Paenibacillus donghaensis]
MKNIRSRHPFPVYLTAGEYMKAIGTQDGYFPDFGHHLAGEMGGIWLHPIKLLDGFWLRIKDKKRDISVWAKADEFNNYAWGSEFRYDHGLGHIPVSIRRTQFAPELEKGMVVSYELHNYSDQPVELELELLCRTDLRPVWFSEEIGIRDGEEDRFETVSDWAGLAKDSENDWFVKFGADMPGVTGQRLRTGAGLIGPEWTAGKGTGLSITSEKTLAPGEVYVFHAYIAGSYTSQAECEATYTRLQDHEELLRDKKRKYEQIDAVSRLEVEGEERLNDIFSWVKWNTQWLVQRVDSIGRGLTAGSPHYPWWFGCDNSYSIQGLMAIGDFELAKDTVDILRRSSWETNGNGRIVHEITTMGAVANLGNTQETAHFIAMIWEMFCWTGDLAFLRENYETCVKGMDWLLQEMDPDQDLFPSGYGIIEISGLNMELIDSAVYTAQAAWALAQMSSVLFDFGNAEAYQALADRMKNAINDMYWCESEGLFADAVAPKKDIVPKVDHLVRIAEKHGISGYREYLEGLLGSAEDEEADRGWLLNKNWVIVTPMETGIADPEKGRRALERMRSGEFIGEYGTYLSGLYQSEIMTISTGAHAVAEAVYGNPNAALDLLQRMMSTFSMALPGSMNEMSPDYGCAVQAWTVYAVAVPIIRHLIGIKPLAHLRSLHIKPLLPDAWEGKQITLRQLRIGDTTVDITLMSKLGTLQADIINPSGYKVILEWNGETYISEEKQISITM